MKVVLQYNTVECSTIQYLQYSRMQYSKLQYRTLVCGQDVLARLQSLVEVPFARVSYSEAVEMIRAEIAKVACSYCTCTANYTRIIICAPRLQRIVGWG